MIVQKKVIGWLLMIIGFIILVTPFTPGSILLLIGANMVFGDRERFQKIKARIYDILIK